MNDPSAVGRAFQEGGGHGPEQPRYLFRKAFLTAVIPRLTMTEGLPGVPDEQP